MKLVLKSLVLGFLASAALAGVLLAIGVGPMISIYVLSGTPTAMLLEALLPSSFWYWLVPEGGAPAAAGVFLCGAFLQWGCIFSALFYWFRRRRVQPDEANKAPASGLWHS